MSRTPLSELLRRLEEKVDYIDKKYDGKHEDMEEAFKAYRHSTNTQISVIKAYIDKRMGYEEGFEKAKAEDLAIKSQIKSGDIRVPKEIITLLLKFIAFATLALGIIQGVLSAK